WRDGLCPVPKIFGQCTFGPAQCRLWSLPINSCSIFEFGCWMFILMASTQQILGIRFFDGDVEEAVAFMFQHGGFLVAPSGTCFSRLRHDTAYRKAVINADV